MRDHLRAEGLDGARAAQIAAHRTRDRKEQLPADEVLRQHRELAARHGHQAERVVAQAREQARDQRQAPEKAAQVAVTYARDHLFERTAVESGRSILTAALNRSMGEATFAEVQREFERRAVAGEFRRVEHGAAGKNGHEGPRYTTASALRMERDIVERMREGNRRGSHDPMLVEVPARLATLDRHPRLNAGQREAAEQVFRAREKIVGLDGVAGAGKTTLAVIREASRGRAGGSRALRPRAARRKSWARRASRP